MFLESKRSTQGGEDIHRDTLAIPVIKMLTGSHELCDNIHRKSLGFTKSVWDFILATVFFYSTIGPKIYFVLRFRFLKLYDFFLHH